MTASSSGRVCSGSGGESVPIGGAAGSLGGDSAPIPAEAGAANLGKGGGTVSSTRTGSARGCSEGASVFPGRNAFSSAWIRSRRRSISACSADSRISWFEGRVRFHRSTIATVTAMYQSATIRTSANQKSSIHALNLCSPQRRDRKSVVEGKKENQEGELVLKEKTTQ